jgi:SAM-dependent methyltransferase
MSLYADHILPRCIDFALSRPPILELRARAARELEGRVLEIGFGSGLNLPYYPSAVTQILALDPAPAAQRLSRKRISACAIPLQWLALAGDTLPLPTASVDAVLSTFTLCTIADVEATLVELKRVLKACGKLHFVEHGRSHEPNVARWQERLTPLQKRVAGGCHLDRPIADLLRNAGFCLDRLDTYYMPGPRISAYIYEGVACACRKDATA